MSETSGRIVITGATGFVGSYLYEALRDGAAPIVRTTRDPTRAVRSRGGTDWAKLDVDDPATIRALLQPGDQVFYLIHGMAEGEDYADREEASARAFAEIARENDVARIIYLGGTKPEGTPSKHLASRLRTGEILRASGVPAVELRAGMIIGGGSESWKIARDLAVRLPLMLTPKWLRNRCEPIAIDDVVFALVHSMEIWDEACGVYPLPGPEVMTFDEILMRIASLRDLEPVRLRVPFLSPKLSSHWLRLVTGADLTVAKELVEGMKTDMVSPDEGFWKLFPDHELTTFDEAAELALRDSEAKLTVATSVAERFIRSLTPSGS